MRTEIVSMGVTRDLGRGQRGRLWELLVFLFLIVPSLVVSFFALQQAAGSFDFLAWATIVRDLALVSLVAYFLWRNGETLALVGWTARGLVKEVAIGVALFVPLLVGASLLEQLFRHIGMSGTLKSAANVLTPRGPWQLALAGLLVLVVAVCEETIFRGYLILRLYGLTGSAAAAALISSFIFSLGHGYEGTAGAATVGAMGLALAVVYLWRGSLVAPMVMHFLQDFLAIVVVPLLVHK